MALVKQLPPPDAKIRFDTLQSRYVGLYKPFGTVSRAIQLHGERGALDQALKQLWTWAGRCDGEVCPIEGIMDVVV